LIGAVKTMPQALRVRDGRNAAHGRKLAMPHLDAVLLANKDVCSFDVPVQDLVRVQNVEPQADLCAARGNEKL